MTDLMIEASLLLRAQPALLTGAVLLLALGGSATFMGLREFSPLLAFALAAFLLYAPVHVEPRFLGSFVLLLFLTPIVGARMQRGDERAGTYIAVVVFLVMVVGALDVAYRFCTLRLAVPGNGPSSALEHVVVAERITQMGLKPGDSVAVIGDGTGAYWARLAKAHIMAEVMGANHDSRRFWRSSDAVQQSVLRVFASSGAKIVIADSPTIVPNGEWIRIGNTDCYMRYLTGDAGQALKRE